MSKYYLFSLIACTFAFNAFSQSTANDSAAVEESVSKYIQSFYQSKPEYFQEAVHSDLSKRSVKEYGDQGDFLKNASYEEMVLLTKIFNRKGKYSTDSKAEVIILDMTPTNASVKLIAAGWYDYIHLAKLNGEWKIVNVLWDYSTPKSQK